MSFTSIRPNKKLLLFLILLASLLYLPMLTLQELRSSDEALWGNLASQLIDSGDYFTPSLSGTGCSCFPLYSWLVALCSLFQHPTAWSVRLPAVLSIFGMALLAGLTARRLKDSTAGFTAAMVVLTSYVSLKIGIIGQNETVHAFFLSAAWIAWHRFGCQEEKWTKAWSLSLGLVFLGILTVGIKTLLLFYFPLLLTRKPGKNLRNLESPTHAFFLTLLIIALIIWARYTTFPVVLGSFSEIYREFPVSFLSHLFQYPTKIFLYMMPWSLFLWAPFCLALRQFEPTGSFCSYLRATIFCPFLLFWLIPGYSPLLLFACLVPAAILIGIHSEIVIRRYAHIFYLLCEIASWPIFLGLLLIGVFWFRVATGGILIIPALGSTALNKLLPLAVSLLLFCLSAVIQHCILRREHSLPLLHAILIMVFAGRLLFIFSIGLLNHWLIPDHRLNSLALFDLAPRGAFQPIVTDVLGKEPPPEQSYRDLEHQDGIIYVHSSRSYPVEAFYSQKQWKYISNPNTELPRDRQEVFMLSSRIPAVPDRDWIPVGPTVNMSTRRNISFEFTGNVLRFQGKLCRKPLYLPSRRLPDYLRLYRGTLRQENIFSSPVQK